jgi:hypothetical protein
MVFEDSNLFDPFEQHLTDGSDASQQGNASGASDTQLHAWMEELEMIRLQVQALTQRRRELEQLVLAELSQREVKQYTLGRGRLRAIVSSKLVPVDIAQFAERFPHLVRVRYEPDQRAIHNQLQMQGGDVLRQHLKEEWVITIRTDDRKSIPPGQTAEE